jgi:hypothetical protein
MFRLRLAPESHARASSGSGPLPVRAIAVAVVCLLAVGIVAGWLLGRDRKRADDSARDAGPLILQIQKLGHLHSASISMSEVLHQDSAAEPEDWIKNVPGASGIVHWATHNRALVTATGSVEAGVDLAAITPSAVQHITGADGTRRLVVHLPPITVYPPRVQVHVERTDPGPFWRDENIVPKAEMEADRRFRDAAEKAGIEAIARTNAIESLNHLMGSCGYRNVDFEF